MKIFVICSKKFYDKIPAIQKELEARGHSITLPNCYDDPGTEERYRNLGSGEHSKWKAGMLQHSAEVIQNNDAVLVLNFEKNGYKTTSAGRHFWKCTMRFDSASTFFFTTVFWKGCCTMRLWGSTPFSLAAI